MRKKSAVKSIETVQSPGAERYALAALLVFTIVAIAGFATFGRHPGLLGDSLLLREFYGVAFTLFAQAHVWLAGAVMLVLLIRRCGVRWVPAFVTAYGIGLAMELAGTGSGIPFGEYGYGPGLGAKWFGQVPVTIPLSWFYMALPSYVVATMATRTCARRIALASLLLLSWDLALDPAMSYVTSYWFWGEVGPYYGMPLLNLAGWYVTGLLLMAGFEMVRATSWTQSLPVEWLTRFYLINVLLPVGMCAVAGAWGAVLATSVVLAGTYALLARRGLRIDTRARVRVAGAHA